MTKCKVCNSKSELFGNSLVLEKHDVKYYKCSNCGFIQTEEPYWLEEAYNNAIASSDVGIVKRNIELAEVTKTLINNFFKKENKFLDYGGGFGLFVRLMRDKGFNFLWHDKYAENLFARSFEIDNSKKYDLLTAFEVFEHLVDPVAEGEEMLKLGDSIFLSTVLLPKSEPKPGEWWYYSTFAGQHVSIYTEKSLRILAEKFELNFYTNGKNLHLLTKKSLSNSRFKIMINNKSAHFFNLFSKYASLIDSDFEKITGSLLRKVK